MLYRSKTKEARRTAAAKKKLAKSIPDKTCQRGPLDLVDNFLSDSFSTKRFIDISEHSTSSKLLKHVCVSDNIVKCIPNTPQEITGKRAKMKFLDEKEQEQWYEKIISSYNVKTCKYCVYFLYDWVTEETSYDDKDMEILTDD